jgi:hypothetical protein
MVPFDSLEKPSRTLAFVLAAKAGENDKNIIQ